MFLSCRPFVVITTFQQVLWVLKTLLSPGLGSCYNNERPTGQKHKYTKWDEGGNKGKLILTKTVSSKVIKIKLTIS